MCSATPAFAAGGISEPYDPATGKGLRTFRRAARPSSNKWIDPFIGAPGMSVALDDFNGEISTTPGSAFGGGYIACSNGGAPPIGGRRCRTEPALGSEWKRRQMVSPRHALQHAGLSLRQCQELHGPRPTYKDALGRPLVRLTTRHRQ
jgi:hypothetical protein